MKTAIKYLLALGILMGALAIQHGSATDTKRQQSRGCCTDVSKDDK
jgi:hypothetical protein